jgi:hypothetical protein
VYKDGGISMYCITIDQSYGVAKYVNNSKEPGLVTTKGYPCPTIHNTLCVEFNTRQIKTWNVYDLLIQHKFENIKKDGMQF